MADRMPNTFFTWPEKEKDKLTCFSFIKIRRIPLKNSLTQPIDKNKLFAATHVYVRQRQFWEREDFLNSLQLSTPSVNL